MPLKKYYIRTISLLLGVLTPAFAFAQQISQPGAAPKIRLTNPSTSLTLDGVVKMFVELLNIVTALSLSVAIAAFFWGLIVYIYHAGDVKGRKKGRDTLVWGLVGLFIILALTGILQLLKGLLPT